MNLYNDGRKTRLWCSFRGTVLCVHRNFVIFGEIVGLQSTREIVTIVVSDFFFFFSAFVAPKPKKCKTAFELAECIIIGYNKAIISVKNNWSQTD